MNQKIISAGTPSNGQDMDIKQAQHKCIKIFPKIHSKRKKKQKPCQSKTALRIPTNLLLYEAAPVRDGGTHNNNNFCEYHCKFY